MKTVKLLAFFLIGLYLLGCTEGVKKNSEVLTPSKITSIKGKFIRIKDNDRAGVEGILDLVTDIEFRNEHCHFTYFTTKMSGKYSLDDGFIYIYTGGELGTLSLEIVSKDQLEGEGYIHGTFKREGTFEPEKKISESTKKKPNPKAPEVLNSNSTNPFNKYDNEPNETSTDEEIKPKTTEYSPFGSGGSNYGDAPGNDGSGSGTGTGSSRVRLSDPDTGHIESFENATIYLKVTVDENGQIVSVSNIASKTTITEQRIINQVLVAVKKDVRYNKAPGSPLITQYLTIKLYAN